MTTQDWNPSRDYRKKSYEDAHTAECIAARKQRPDSSTCQCTPPQPKATQPQPKTNIHLFAPPEGQWTGDEPPGQARQPVQVKEITVETIEQPEPEPLIITVETETVEHEPLIIDPSP